MQIKRLVEDFVSIKPKIVLAKCPQRGNRICWWVFFLFFFLTKSEIKKLLNS